MRSYRVSSKKRAVFVGLAIVLAAGLVVLAIAHRPVDRRALEHAGAAARERAVQELKANQPDDAEASVRQALHALNKLLDSRPNDRDYRRGRAEALEVMAMALAAQSRPDEAALAYRGAVPLWADLVAERSRNIDDRRSMAACLDRYGLLLVDVGRWDEADYVFSRGRSLCEKIPEILKDEPQVRRDLIVFLSRLARLTLDMGRRSDALENFAGAVAAQRAFAETPPSQPEDRERLIGLLLEQEAAQAALNRPVDAEKSLAEASDVAKRLVAANPAVARYQALAASAAYRLASVIQADSHRISEARSDFERAMAMQEKLVAQPQSGREYLPDLAATCGSLANLLCTQGLYDQAEPLYRRELACQTTLAQERPDDVRARFAHGRVLHNLADFLRDRGRAKEALPLERDAERELTSVYNKDFRNPDYRTALSYARWTLCTLELDREDHRAAAKAIEQYQKIETTGFEEPLESARFLCRSIRLCQADRSLPEAERATLARAYADRAIRALETAVRSGYNNRGELASAGIYEPLRGRDDFARLVQEVEARSRFAGKD